MVDTNNQVSQVLPGLLPEPQVKITAASTAAVDMTVTMPADQLTKTQKAPAGIPASIFPPAGEVAPTAQDSPQYKTATEEFVLRIAHTNDRHSHLDEVARLSTALREVRRADPDVLVLDAGDLLQGTPWYNFFHGEADMKALEKLGYDAFTIGNHDLDEGVESLQKALRYTDTPALAANLEFKGEMAQRVRPYIIKEVQGKKIAVIGLTVNPADYGNASPNLVWRDPVETLKELIPKLKGEADIIVILSHLGASRDAEIAGFFPEISAIIGGHSHTPIPFPQKHTHPDMTATFVTQAGSGNEYLGLLELKIKGGKVIDRRGGLLYIDESIPPDPRMEKTLRPYAKKMNSIINRKVAVTTDVITKTSQGKADSKLGNLMADALLEVAQKETGKKIDIAIYNKTGLRSSIPKGDITIKTMNEVLPFDNTLCTTELTGEQVQEMLSNAARRGGDPVAGLTYTIDNGSATNIRIAGQPIDPAKTYRVATNDYLIGGGSGYAVLTQGKNTQDTAQSIRELFTDYLSRRGTISLPRTVEERTSYANRSDWLKTIHDKLGLQPLKTGDEHHAVRSP